MTPLWTALIGAAAVTLLTRTLPLIVRPPLPETGRARRYLDALPISIIAALAGGAVLAPERRLSLGPEIVAMCAVVIVTAWRRNILAGILAGIVAIAAVRALPSL